MVRRVPAKPGRISTTHGADATNFSSSLEATPAQTLPGIAQPPNRRSVGGPRWSGTTNILPPAGPTAGSAVALLLDH